MTFLTTDDDARYLVAIRSDRLYNPWLLKSRSCVRRTLYDARTTTMVGFACCTSAIAWSTCHGYKNLDLLDTYAIHQAGTNVGYRPGSPVLTSRFYFISTEPRRAKSSLWLLADRELPPARHQGNLQGEIGNCSLFSIGNA
jgi:hypothetical protein